jgi:hypothetical protein
VGLARPRPERREQRQRVPDHVPCRRGKNCQLIRDASLLCINNALGWPAHCAQSANMYMYLLRVYTFRIRMLRSIPFGSYGLALMLHATLPPLALR